MKTPILTLALSLLSAGAAGALTQDGSSGLAVFDLGGLLREVDRGAADFALLPPFSTGGEVPEAGIASDPESLSLGALQDILVRLHEDQLRYRDAEAQSPMIGLLGERRLVVRGSAELRASVGATLEALEELVGKTSRVRLRWYRADAGAFDRVPSSATVDSGELGRLIEVSRAELETEIVFDARLGSTARVDLREAAAVVMDYDVEIASHASVVAPTVGQLRTGEQVVARYVPGLDGGHLTLLATRATAVGKLREERLEVGALFAGSPDTDRRVDIETLELPVQFQDVLTRGVGLAVHVPADSVLIARTRWNLAGTSGDELLAIDVQSEPLELVQRLAVGQEELLLVLRDALDSPRIGTSAGVRVEAMLRTGREFWRRGFNAHIDAASAGVGFDLIPDAGRGWEAFGPWMAAMPGRESDGAATAAVAKALAVGSAASARVTAVGRIGSQVVASFDLPVGAGYPALAFVALSTPIVSDIEVEVATGSGIGDPTVGIVEEGLALTLDPVRGADGAWSLAPVGELSVRTGTLRRATMDRIPGGWVDLAPLARLRASSDVTLAPGNAQTVGAAASVSLALGVR